MGTHITSTHSIAVLVSCYGISACVTGTRSMATHVTGIHNTSTHMGTHDTGTCDLSTPVRNTCGMDTHTLLLV